MAIFKKNPELNDYFVEIPEIKTGATDIKPIIPTYEHSKAIYFPNFKPVIDFDFWGNFDTKPYGGLPKLTTSPNADYVPELDEKEQMTRLAKAGVPDHLSKDVSRHMTSILEQVMPVYKQMFAGYKFTKGQITWRFNEIYSTCMHIDIYPQPLPNHFARIFINLDNQPRIWHTSWEIEEVIKRLPGKFSREELQNLPTNDLWSEFSCRTFGRTADDWHISTPRHVIFFEPGDVWSVDSRLIGHQIFYGRKALSIDFQVDPASMLNPDGQYLKRAEIARAELLAS